MDASVCVLAFIELFYIWGAQRIIRHNTVADTVLDVCLMQSFYCPFLVYNTFFFSSGIAIVSNWNY